MHSACALESCTCARTDPLGASARHLLPGQPPCMPSSSPGAWGCSLHLACTFNADAVAPLALPTSKLATELTAVFPSASTTAKRAPHPKEDRRASRSMSPPPIPTVMFALAPGSVSVKFVATDAPSGAQATVHVALHGGDEAQVTRATRRSTVPLLYVYTGLADAAPTLKLDGTTWVYVAGA